MRTTAMLGLALVAAFITAYAGPSVHAYFRGSR
jgi:hypothetical protein